MFCKKFLESFQLMRGGYAIEQNKHLVTYSPDGLPDGYRERLRSAALRAWLLAWLAGLPGAGPGMAWTSDPLLRIIKS